MQTTAVCHCYYHNDLIRLWHIGDRHCDRIKVVNDQDSSLWLSGTSRLAPQAATLTLDGMTALPPPTAVRAAMLVLAVEADNRALAVGNRRVRQQLDQIRCACVRP